MARIIQNKYWALPKIQWNLGLESLFILYSVNIFFFNLMKSVCCYFKVYCYLWALWAGVWDSPCCDSQRSVPVLVAPALSVCWGKGADTGKSLTAPVVSWHYKAGVSFGFFYWGKLVQRNWRVFFARVRGFESQVIWNLNFIPRNRVLWFSSDINEEQLWFELTNTDI